MALQNVSVEAILGIEVARPSSPLALARLVAAGLPVTALEHLAGAVAPDEPGFKFRLVPKATLQRRRRSTGWLTPGEGDRVVRLAKVFGFALDIYGAPERVRAFLRRPHPMLENHPPLEVALAAGPGADLIIGLLGRAAYGGGV